MIDLAALLALAAAGFGISRLFRLPPLPVLLGIGILVSAFGPAVHFRIDPDFVTQAVQLGLAFLLFSAGIEMNPRRFKRQSRQVFWVAAVQFALAGLAGFLVAGWLGYDTVTSLFIGFAVSASSTLVVLRELKSRQQMFQPFGRLVTGVLFVQDLLMIVIIVVFLALPGGAANVAVAAGGLILLGAVAAAAHWLVLPAVVRRLDADDEILLLFGLGVLFAFIGMSAALGVPFAAGAFLAGFALSVFPVNGLLRGLLGSLSDFFQAIFFVALGAVVAVNDGTTLLHALALAGLILLITPPVVAAVAEWQGSSSRSGIESGLLLAQTSEFALVLGLAGVASGQISHEVFSMVALVAVITMTWTPFVATDNATWKLLHFHPMRRRVAEPGDIDGHVVLLGFGSGGSWVAKPLLASGLHVLAVDDDPVVIEQLENAKIPCLRGDASDEKLLERAAARRAKLVIVALPRVADAEKIIRYVPGVPVVARVFDERDAAAIRAAGGIPVVNSEAATDKFIEWFEKTPFPTEARG